MHRLEKIKRKYVINTESINHVEKFLLANLHLLDVLDEATVEIKRVYPGATLCLDAYSHGLSAKSDELGILIKTDTNIDVAMMKMVDLDNRWWLDVMPSTKGKLFIDLYDLHNGAIDLYGDA